ncbi:MAG: hypothetical protein ITD40_06005 [Nitrosarchaeum sp.]|nr:hypothetical protein [Nitrosarchaeum sp.]
MDIFSDFQVQSIISLVCMQVMFDVLKCECPPGSESHENDEGMQICLSCGGWMDLE